MRLFLKNAMEGSKEVDGRVRIYDKLKQRCRYGASENTTFQSLCERYTMFTTSILILTEKYIEFFFSSCVMSLPAHISQTVEKFCIVLNLKLPFGLSFCQQLVLHSKTYSAKRIQEYFSRINISFLIPAPPQQAERQLHFFLKFYSKTQGNFLFNLSTLLFQWKSFVCDEPMHNLFLL